MSGAMPATAMLLAAGLGTRMKPLTDRTPKPLIEVGGKALIDWQLDQLGMAGVLHTVVNVHHLAPQITEHLKLRQKPTISISDETKCLLDTGGGIVKALPVIGGDPFFVFSCDTITLDGETPALNRLANAWNPDELDVLMLLHPMETAHGFDGAVDFFRGNDGFLTRRGTPARAPYAYTGIQIMHPRVMTGEKAKPFPMNKVWDRAIATHRLKAVVHDGMWFHVGTPDAVEKTNAALLAR